MIGRLLTLLVSCLWVPSIQAESSSAVPDETLLIVMPEGELFETAKNGLVNELREVFSFSVLKVTETTAEDRIDGCIESVGPRAVVLIGNRAIRLYAAHARKHREIADTMLVVAILALDVKRAAGSLGRVQGIAYETPMVTALVNFRSVINRPFTSVGVVYRQAFSEFVAKHTEYCGKEKITVKSIQVGDDVSLLKRELSRALQQLVKKDRVDAFWVPNDNVILRPELLTGVWLPLFGRQKIPIIVGVEALVRPDLNFGTYAVVPDPEAMGEQAAGLIIDVKDDDWNFRGVRFFPAISMYSILNYSKATSIADEKNINLNHVTRVLRTDGKE